MIARKKDAFQKRPTARITPDFIAENIYTIDFALLRSHGIKACFIDLDGTVVERSQYDVHVDIKTALQNSGMQVYIATNRPRSMDLKDLKETLGAKGVVHPHGIFAKPAKRYFSNALKDTGLSSHEVIMIGDRVFQDILGSNRAGMYSLLVYKLGKPVGFIDKLISALERLFTRHISRRYH